MPWCKRRIYVTCWLCSFLLLNNFCASTFSKVPSKEWTNGERAGCCGSSVTFSLLFLVRVKEPCSFCYHCILRKYIYLWTSWVPCEADLVPNRCQCFVFFFSPVSTAPKAGLRPWLDPLWWPSSCSILLLSMRPWARFPAKF